MPSAPRTEFVWFENYHDALRRPRLSTKPSSTPSIFSTFVLRVLAVDRPALRGNGRPKTSRRASIYKTLLIWPYAVAPAIAGVLWIFMFDPSLGMLARGLQSLGIPTGIRVLNGNHAMLLVILAATWKQISYNFLFFLAGLQSIPKSVIEAAVIDGARPMRRFWTIVFPLLSPTTFFLLVVNIVYVFFDTFGIIDTVTGGGPRGATETLVYKVFADGKARLQSRRLGGTVRHPADHGDRAHGDPVPLHRAQGRATDGVRALAGSHRRRAALQQAAQDAVVVLPVASIEQHGPHLPVGVDTILLWRRLQGGGASGASDVEVVVAPMLWCGMAEHHMAFGGTFTFDIPTYRAVLLSLPQEHRAARLPSRADRQWPWRQHCRADRLPARFCP